MATEYAFTVAKPKCGCVTFARLTCMRKGIALGKVTKGGVVDRVPVAKARVVVCRCKG